MKEENTTENSVETQSLLAANYSQAIVLGYREKELDYSAKAQAIYLDIEEDQLEDYFFS